MKNFPEFDGPMHQWPRVEPVRGIHSTLQILKRSSVVGLATNAVDSDQRDIMTALERCDLSRFFNHVFCFRQLGVRKPESAFYSRILDHLNLDPESVYMVGDDLDADVLAANALGIAAVWFNFRSHESRSGPLHRTVHDLIELPSALHELGAVE